MTVGIAGEYPPVTERKIYIGKYVSGPVVSTEHFSRFTLSNRALCGWREGYCLLHVVGDYAVEHANVVNRVLISQF